jgi:hypothetical protein
VTVDIYDLIYRTQLLQRDVDRLGGGDPLVSLRHRHRLLRTQVADVVRLMRYADALGEMPAVTQTWAQVLEDALDHDEP